MGNVAVVIGVGPGIGSSVAKRFATGGYAVALMSRGQDKLAPVRQAIEDTGGTALAVTCDATDEDSVQAAFDRVRNELGAPSVLVYNAGAFTRGTVDELSYQDFQTAWRANCLGAFLCAKQVIGAMAEAGSGTVIFTGATASIRGSAGFAALAVGKFGLRALSQSLARELGPKGVHVAHVVIDGMVDLERTRGWFPDRGDECFLSPDAIADNYWNLHQQHHTTWTQELDLRPAVEKF